MLVYQMVFPNGSNDHLEVFGEQLWEFTKVRHSLALSRSHFFVRQPELDEPMENG